MKRPIGIRNKHTGVDYKIIDARINEITGNTVFTIRGPYSLSRKEYISESRMNNPSSGWEYIYMTHIVDKYKNWQPRFAAYAKWPRSQDQQRKLQAIMEMSGEALEVLQVATKARRKGIDIPKEKVIDELGDTLWGIVGIMNEFGITFEELIEYNMDKLTRRNS